MIYSWMEISLDAIAQNYRTIQSRMGQKTQIIAVVKADAYGLGAIPIAERLEKEGCSFFAVTFIEEALELRAAGIRSEILVMMPIEPEETKAAAENGLTVTMGDVRHAVRVSEKLVNEGSKLKMHIKADCGLSRMGIVVKDRFDEALEEAKTVAMLPGFVTEGIYTHITNAGQTEGWERLDKDELTRYVKLADALEAEGIKLKRHSICSDPLLNYPEYKEDFIRIGTLLYGVHPQKYQAYEVRNCLSLKSRIVQVKTIPANTAVSYGPLYSTTKDTKAAIVPIGFADGIRRALSNIGCMIVRGKKVPIIGKICCDHTILDVTELDEVSEGDIVTIFGRDGEEVQYAGDFARLCKASEPETTSILSQRIPRNYISIRS